MVTRGDAFLFLAIRSHLWVVISDPDPVSTEFVIVNLTTLKDNTLDESCVLEPDDYPSFIKHQTVVFYPDARLWSLKNFNSRDVKMMPKFSPDVLLRIQQGALVSNFFPPDFVSHVKKSLVVSQFNQSENAQQIDKGSSN